MKKTFGATVVGMSQTDTSGFATGAHSVSFDILAQAPLGQVPRRVELPLFSVEEARELGALYRNNGAISVTVQTASAEGVAAVETMRRESLRSAIEEAVRTLHDAMSGRMPTVNKCRSVSANLRDAAGAMFGGDATSSAADNPPPAATMAAAGEPENDNGPDRFADTHFRILAMPVDKRHEAMRRASRSFSAPDTCVRHDGCRIDGEDVVWPDGERWPTGKGTPSYSVAVETAQRRALRLAIMKTSKMLRDAVNGQLPSVNTCYSTYAELSAAADAVFSAPEHPPIVNGMPSCCEPVKGSLMRIAEHGMPKTKAWALGAHFGIEHCLYCGTKLPALDGAPA